MKIYFLFVSCFYSCSLFSQNEINISANEVISNYLDATGGESKWVNLESRKSKEKYLVYSSGVVETVSQTIPFVKFYQYPNSYLTTYKKGLSWNLIVDTSDCSWIYFGENQSIFLQGQESVKDKEKYPRVEILEFFNLPIKGRVVVEDNYYKIIFIDKFYGRNVSVYFDPHTHLVEKYSYYGGQVHQENFITEYRTKDGFTEPYRIDNYTDGKKFKTIVKEDISYNSRIDHSIFSLPVPCSDFESMTKLDEPLPYIYLY